MIGLIYLRRARSWRSGFVVAASALLAACGGGGDAANGPEVTVTGATALSYSADTSVGGAAFTNPTSVMVLRPDATQYYYSLSFAGTAIEAIDVSLLANQILNTTNPATASGHTIAPAIGATLLGSVLPTGPGMPSPALSINTLDLLRPAALGAGTYTDTIKISICYDAPCARVVPGSPVSIPVTYTVTGNPTSTANVSVTRSLAAEIASNATSAANLAVQVSGSNLPPYGAQVSATPGAGGLIAATSFMSTASGAGTGSGDFTVMLASKPVGIYSDTLTVNVCFDLACTKPAAGNPWTVPITEVVDAVEGPDFTTRSVAISVSDVVWDPLSKKLFVLVPSYSTVNPGTITQIDPFTGAVERSVALVTPGVGIVGAGPFALSDDGQFLYAGTSAGVNDSIERILVSNFSVDATIPLPASQRLMQSIRVAPGQPRTFVLSGGNATPAGAVIYDDATQRPQTFDVASTAIWGADASTIYAYANALNGDTIYRLSVTSSGLTVAQSYTGAGLGGLYTFDSLHLANGVIYSDNGSAFDTGTFMPLPGFQTFASAGSASSAIRVTANASLDRAFFITNDQPLNGTGNYITIEGFTLASRKPLWLARFPSQNGSTLLTRFGSNGLVFATSGSPDSNLVLMSGPVVTH
jgi:hypothetical protein